MLPIPEVTQWLPQNTPIFLDGRLPLMLPETARQLGLTAGQVVPALVRVSGERMDLWLQGRAVEPPPGWRLTPGETIWVSAHVSANGMWVLRRAAGPAADSAVAPTPLAQDNAVAQSAMAASRLRQLWFHPAGMAGLLQLMQPEVMEAVLRSPAMAQWAKAIANNRPAMAQISPKDVEQWLKQTSQTTEAALAQGKAPGATDFKQALAALLKAHQSLPLQGVAGGQLQQAMDDIESAQLQSARAMEQREVLISTVIPFRDAPPVHLEVRRERARASGEALRWWVNLYTESPGLGQVWMQAGLGLSDAIDMQVWATQSDTVLDARARAADLRQLLAQAGLKLEQFQVIQGVKPSLGAPAGAPSGSVLDVQA